MRERPPQTADKLDIPQAARVCGPYLPSNSEIKIMEPIFGNSNSRFTRAIRNFKAEIARGPNGDDHDVYVVYTEDRADGNIGIKTYNGKNTFPQWLLDKYIPADYRVVVTSGSTNAWHGKVYAKMDHELLQLLEIRLAVTIDPWAD